LIGKNFVFYDTLHVPTYAPDTNFQFHITAVDISTHQPVPNLPIELWIDDTAFTYIYDTTDVSGTAFVTYDYNLADTLIYDVSTGHSSWPGYSGQTQAVKGIPEVVTLCVGELR
jgi:hypothetical protein